LALLQRDRQSGCLCFANLSPRKLLNTDLLEKNHKRGYERHPVGKTEFSIWESEQEWGDN